MKKFEVPTLQTVPSDSVRTLEGVKTSVGFIPNIYAFIGNSPAALKTYMIIGNTKKTLTPIEVEIINLTASSVRNCHYCLSAHSGISKGVGLSDEQIMEIRHFDIRFNKKYYALGKMVEETVKNQGHVSEQTKENFFTAGYTNQQLVEMIIVVAQITITNYINNITNIPIDFPLAPELK